MFWGPIGSGVLSTSMTNAERETSAAMPASGDGAV
jgi:hypothetical protein